MMQWFGRAFGAPFEADFPHASTPIGSLCVWCREAIGPEDNGLIMPLHDISSKPTSAAYHHECHLRTIIGGVNHQLHLCCCPGCAGVLPSDPPALTRREAARAAVVLMIDMQRARPLG